MRIRLFGGVEVEDRAGDPVRLPTRKTSLLLAALALAGAKGAGREQLCAAFWPDRGESQARNSLRQALTAIRRAIQGEEGDRLRVEGDLDTVRLAGTAGDVDAWRFDEQAGRDAPAELAEAGLLYRGDLLAGVALPEPLDQWFQPYQLGYRRKALALAERLGGMAGADPHACQTLAEHLLAADPAAEEAHRALIRLYRRQGQQNAALRQFELCKIALQRELDAAPEAQTLALMADLGTAGAALTAPPPAPVRDRDRPSVVVMPFDNLSGASDEYFVDGVVEEVTAALSRVRDFFVIARQSAFTYKGRLVDVRAVGRELGVNYVVEGTIRRGGDQLRISVQLVDAESRTQLWSDRYEGSTTDIFAFQDQIAAQVAGAIHPAVRQAEIEAARRKPPGNLKAYDLVMRAYPMLWGHNASANDQAIAILREAVKVDMAYGRAHALLAWCLAVKATYVWSMDPDRECAMALAEVDTAGISIDDDPTALTAAGAAVSLSGDQERATAYFEKALALDSNNAWAWTRFGWLAIYRGELDRAKDNFERAITLSPVDPFAFNMRMGIASAIALAGNLLDAIAIARDVINKNPDVTWCYRQLAAWSAMNGDLTTARWAVQKLLAGHPNITVARYRALPFFRSAPQVHDTMVEALRLAGLPEK